MRIYEKYQNPKINRKGILIYGSSTQYTLDKWAEIHKYYGECDWPKKWAEGLQKILT